MSNAPFFTVITPVYNRSKIVPETIRSVLKQKFTDYEYILVNDASTDESLKSITEFAEEDPRIKIINLDKNVGRCAARNEGLANAKGGWVCYLDSDDQYYENHLEVMFNSIKAHPDIKVFAVDQHINGKLKNYRRSNLHRDQVTLTLTNFIEGNPLTANQVCHSVNINIRWSKERIPISEDWLFLRTISLYHPILKIGQVTNNLRDHEERSMNTTNADNFVKYNLIAASKFVEENELPNNIKSRVFTFTHLLCTNVYLNQKLKKEAWRLFKACLVKPRTYFYPLFYKALIKFLF